MAIHLRLLGSLSNLLSSRCLERRIEGLLLLFLLLKVQVGGFEGGLGVISQTLIICEIGKVWSARSTVAVGGYTFSGRVSFFLMYRGNHETL